VTVPAARQRPRTIRIALLGMAMLAACSQPAMAQAPATGTSSGVMAPTGAPPATAPGNAMPEDAAALMKTDRFRQLASELRCLVCQNQSLVDSNAPLAQDLRAEVVKLMASGRNDDQIKSFLVDRYGEFVLYRPTLSLRNALLWLGPFLLLAIGAIAWWRLGRQQAAPAQSASEALRHVDELLGPRR
jgi:cytochrome c-type biogenesis protein CcmH